MSGIAGVLSFDRGAPISHRQVDSMARALEPAGPDDLEIHRHPFGCMIYRALHMTPESSRVRQPFETPDGLLLAWDGRLDNRRELLSHLELTPSGTRDVPGIADVEVVAAAYRRWGRSFLEFVVGDFALALWDETERSLILARDPMASRPLFAAMLQTQILWASTSSALLASGEIPAEVDDDWVAAFLVNAQPADSSPFRAMEGVPPGGMLVFSPSGQARHTFWDIEAIPEVRYRRDEEYEEALREHFLDAVRGRLRVPGTVFAELSGGLDSSSVVCAAHRLIERGDVAAQDLVTYSLVFDRAREADERHHISIVEAATGRESLHVLEDDYPFLAGFECEPMEVPNFWHSWPAARKRAFSAMKDRGARCLLSGFAGDHLLWSGFAAPFHLADHAARFELLRLGRGLRAWHRCGYAYPQLFWKGILQPLGCALQGRGTENLEFDFKWLGESVRARRLEHLSRCLGRPGKIVLPSRRARFEALRWAISDRAWVLDPLAHGLEVSYPFLHQPLVELCLGIPFSQLVRPGEMRSLHRRALSGLLPEVIAQRRDKRGPSEAILRGMRREWAVIQQLFGGSDARVYERGLIDRRPFLHHLEEIRAGLLGDHAILVRVLQVEVWLRALERAHQPAVDGGHDRTPGAVRASARRVPAHRRLRHPRSDVTPLEELQVGRVSGQAQGE